MRASRFKRCDTALIKTLILDIETFPSEAYVWSLFDQFVTLDRLIRPGGVASWAAKWYGSDEVEYSSVNMATYEEMMYGVWELLNEADEVVTWNGNSFDLKHLNAAFAVLGFGPPSPYKRVDLMRVVKKNMKFVSNKLDFVSGQFAVGKKLEHEGFKLWVKCMKGEKKAWKQFEEYNIEDVLLTERMYEKLRGWIHCGVNRSNVSSGFVCPECGSSHLNAHGYAFTGTMKYRRYQCMNCGAWARQRVSEKEDRSQQLVRVAT